MNFVVPSSKRRREPQSADPRRWSVPAQTPAPQRPVPTGISLGRRLSLGLPTPAAAAVSTPIGGSAGAAAALPPLDDDIDDDISEDEAAPAGAQAPAAQLPLLLPPLATPAQPAHRSSLVAGLSLHVTQLGESAGARAGRQGSRRSVGLHGELARRAKSDEAYQDHMLLVKHRLAGPQPPSREALRCALHDTTLRHRCAAALAAAAVTAAAEHDATHAAADTAAHAAVHDATHACRTRCRAR